MKKSVVSKLKSVMFDDGCYLYGIDLLEFASKKDFKELKEDYAQFKNRIKRFCSIKDLVLYNDVIDLDILRRSRAKETQRKKYKYLYKKGYKSIIRMKCPTPEFFEILIKEIGLFGMYIPWYIELYKDMLLNSEHDAIIFTERQIDITFKQNFSCKKSKESNMNISEVFLFDPKNPYKWNTDDSYMGTSEGEYEEWQKKNPYMTKYNPRILNSRTLYLGSDVFKYVIYASQSKRGEKPCVHSEWRILWADNYKMFNKLGITKKNGSYLESLRKLTGFDLAKKWEKLTGTHIKQAEINEEKLGKLLKDCCGSPESFDEIPHKWRQRKKLTDGEELSVNFWAHSFLRAYEVETTSEFVKLWQEYWGQDNGAKSEDSVQHISEYLKDVSSPRSYPVRKRNRSTSSF